MRKSTADDLAKSFKEQILSRFATPKVFVSVNGSQFASKIVGKYMKEIGVNRQFTSPYTPQESLTERANRTIKTMIAQIGRNQHNKWDECIPEINLALNTSISESTTYSPAYLVHGRERRLPFAFFDDDVLGTGTGPHDPNS